MSEQQKDALAGKVALGPKQVISLMESQIKEDLDILDDVMDELGHSQAKRLLLASAAYPMRDDTSKFYGDSEIKAFSALKRIKDATVALGVEVVIESIMKDQQNAVAEQQAQETKE